MTKFNKFSPEVRDRAVRMVLEHRGEYHFRSQGGWTSVLVDVDADRQCRWSPRHAAFPQAWGRKTLGGDPAGGCLGRLVAREIGGGGAGAAQAN